MQVIGLFLSESVKALIEDQVRDQNIFYIDEESRCLDVLNQDDHKGACLVFIEGFDRHKTIETIRKTFENCLLVPILDVLDVEIVVSLVKKQVFDVVIKPLTMIDILMIIQKARRFFEFIQDNSVKIVNINHSSQISWIDKNKSDVNAQERIDLNKKVPRLLIVEDNILIAAQYKKHLKKNWVVHHVDSIQKAKKEMFKHFFDAVILDLHLKDGISSDLVSEFKKKQPQAEIMIMTAYKELDLIKKTIDLGAYDYCVKGADLSQFLVKMSHLACLIRLRQLALNKPLELR